MQIKLSRAADKFLKKLDSSEQKAVIVKIGTLKTCLETQKIYPPEELDIKKRDCRTIARQPRRIL